MRVAGTVERNVVGCCLAVWYAKASNITHVTRGKSVMSLHAHYHRNCWDIVKGQNQICSKGEELPVEDIISVLCT